MRPRSIAALEDIGSIITRISDVRQRLGASLVSFERQSDGMQCRKQFRPELFPQSSHARSADAAAALSTPPSISGRDSPAVDDPPAMTTRLDRTTHFGKSCNARGARHVGRRQLRSQRGSELSRRAGTVLRERRTVRRNASLLPLRQRTARAMPARTYRHRPRTGMRLSKPSRARFCISDRFSGWRRMYHAISQRGAAQDDRRPDQRAKPRLPSRSDQLSRK